MEMLRNKLAKYETVKGTDSSLTEKDSVLITYGDSIIGNENAKVRMLHRLLNKYVGDSISAVHLLPMFPYTSDDGFSVVDYKKINSEIGDWPDIEALGKDYSLMFDAVINHISKESDWFKRCLAGDSKYKEYFIEKDENFDCSRVVRPRTSPLFTAFETADGPKSYWSTFSADQIDINFASVDLATDIMELLVYYAMKGARYIRLDAIGFLWKDSGTTCIHHEKTHEMIKVMREVLDEYAPGTLLITETNVPHKENISYFGNGYDEAQLVYQFPLPPLTLFSFMTENAEKLSKWAASLEPLTDRTTYFNFLSSHDGVGLRPTEGILTDDERKMMAKLVLARGGKINYKTNEDGSKSPYELNVNYQDALSGLYDDDDTRIKRFIASHVILMSVVGMPAIYIHSLLGSRNDYYGVETSGINRRINREKLDYDLLDAELEKGGLRKRILDGMLKALDIRREHSAFSPYACQEVLDLDKRIFAVRRVNKDSGESIVALVNVSTQDVEMDPGIRGMELFTKEDIDGEVDLAPLEYKWILEDRDVD